MSSTILSITFFSVLSIVFLYNSLFVLCKHHVVKSTLYQLALVSFITMLLANWSGLSYGKDLATELASPYTSLGFETFRTLLLSWYEPMLFLSVASMMLSFFSLGTDVRVARIFFSSTLVLELVILISTILL